MANIIVEPTHRPTKTGSPLLDQFWHAARTRGESVPTAEVFAAWARRFVLFHDKRHPREMGLPQVTHFLEHVAKTEREPLPAIAQNIRSVQLLLGHESLETTMIYTHVARKGVTGVTSPLDLLNEISDQDVQAAVLATTQAPLH